MKMTRNAVNNIANDSRGTHIKVTRYGFIAPNGQYGGARDGLAATCVLTECKIVWILGSTDLFHALSNAMTT